MIPPAAVAAIRAASWEAHRLAIAHPEDIGDHIADALDEAGWDIHPAPEPVEPLHPRQDQVLLGWARGWTDQQIANELGLSLSTVLTYGKRLRRRLGATCRAHAVAIGYETGLLRHGDAPTGRPDHPAPRSTGDAA